MNMLEIKHLDKSFGSKQVLHDLNLVVPQGSIFGFVGENGAGKTTTMRLVLGLEKSDRGQIEINHELVHFGQTPTNRFTGYLPDVPAFYNYLTPREYLKLCAQITKIPARQQSSRIDELLSLVGLANVKQRINGFSRGMKQRLGIAQALLNRPQLLICDEPTSALDPQGRQEFLELLASLRGQTTILFSTHILPDVERICDQVGILHDGQLRAVGSLATLKQQYAQPLLQITMATAQEAATLAQWLQQNPSLAKDAITTDASVITIPDAQENNQTWTAVLEALTQQTLIPLKIEQVAPSLEQIFLKVVQPT
ncbi:ABC transporter ATP-binding protein [Lapidilactobacillus wuchangensis]|uniref:ABC transporter ATP-binding protein n=1 Tax=Lapidilactobacillus wuchangensis TaxID=2486001 RepID=UPI000F777FB0|nr:ABC transporter ATP-binding protein [Lapidilactobacillus wuchangensis]